MKRLIMALFLVSAAVAGCGGEDAAPADVPAEGRSGWAAPPVIEEVAAGPAGVQISGRAGPSDRVRLTAPEGGAHGATADSEGRFVVELPPSAEPRLFQATILRTGRITPGPERLFLPPGGGPGALLRPGGGTLVFGPGKLIMAVDYDGGGALVSGRASPGTEVRISVDGSAAAVALAGPDGRYTAQLPPTPPGVRQIRAVAAADAAAVDLNLRAPTDATFTTERTAIGWMVTWPLPGGGAQSTWLIGEPGA